MSDIKQQGNLPFRKYIEEHLQGLYAKLTLQIAK